MHEADQFELPLPERSDLDVALEKQWRANEIAQAEYWGPDVHVIYWWAAGSWDREGWEALPSYERDRWRTEYECERQLSIATGRPLQPAADIYRRAKAAVDQAEEIAESWAKEIRKAFLERRPCPIVPAPGFEGVLEWAFLKAQVPQECLAAAEPENAPRGTNPTATP
jgi:hypothetical protein